MRGCSRGNGDRRSSVSRKARKNEATRCTSELAEQVRKGFRQNDAVLERITRARRRLRSVREYPPLPIRRARQVDRKQVQVRVTRYGHIVTRPPESGVREYQSRRNVASAKQLLRTVKVRQYPVQQARALDQRRFPVVPIPMAE